MAPTRSTASRAARGADQTTPRARLARSTKPKNLYVGDSSDDDAESDVETSDASIISDADDPSDDEDVGGRAAHDNFDIHPPRRTSSRAKRTTPRKRNIPSQSSASKTTKASNGSPARNPGRKNATPTPKKPKRPRDEADNSKLTPRKSPEAQKQGDVQDSVIPNWLDPAVPYSAWIDVFYYAAMAGGSLDNSWLLHTATACRAFSEPALTVLYRSPSPQTSIKAKKLLAVLEHPPSDTLLNYRIKIESLYIDISKFPLALLPRTIQPLQRLKELVIYTHLDQPPYRDLDKTIRWHYPQELFDALHPTESTETGGLPMSPIVLKSWEWSSRLLGGPVPNIDAISTIHQLPSFANLTRVSFTNFQVPSLHMTATKQDDEAAFSKILQQDVETIDAIAASISQLKSLKHLVFESSTVMNDRLLELLPTGLLHLELINCWEVRSDDLAKFLRTHGHNMRSLILLHNQSLDLGFLPDLAETAPNLRELRVNMSYYRHHDSLDDSDPMYDQALLPTQLPLWPDSLRYLEIDNVRQWSVEAAEMFLQSLVDSAPNLPNLRYLSIKTMLDIPWQRRAELRRTWTDKLERVFLRVCDPPKPLMTLRPIKDTDQASSSLPAKKRRKEPTTPSRRSGRIADHTSDLDVSPSRPQRGIARRPLYIDPDTDEDEIDESEPEEPSPIDSETSRDDEHAKEEKLSVQGMCHTVIAKFDNQKVRELQYGMEDFEDEDESSGKEWDGDDDDDDASYAW